MKRFLSVFLILVLLVTMAVPVSADEIIGEMETEIEIRGLTELNVRTIVSRYFAQRKAYLQGTADTISAAHERRIDNEEIHKEALAQANAVLVDSAILINTVEIGDYTAWVTATETVTYEINSEELTEVIFHEILVEMMSNNVLMVRSDGYYESLINFASAAYRDPNMAPGAEGYLTNAVNTGSASCIIAIARTQLGYTEGANNYTKYGVWYTDYKSDGDDYSNVAWCAMFVSWCAYYANVPNSVIYKTSWVPTMRDEFSYDGLLASSASYTPKAGDIIFFNGDYYDPWHVGIVTGVSGAYIYYIDGNSESTGNVQYTYISKYSESIVAFGKSAYETSSHIYGSWSYDASSHWRYCVNCDTIQSSAHSTYIDDNGKTVCSVCGYTK